MPDTPTQASSAGQRPPAVALRLSAFYAALFVLAGAKVPFLPLWLDWRGLTPEQISIVVSAPLLLRIVVTPALAYAIDRYGDRRRALIALAWAALGMLLVLTLLADFWSILVVTLLVALAWTTIMPVTETVTMAHVRTARLDYGRMRLWGSLSFIAASVAGGAIIARLGAGAAVWLMIAGAALTALAAHILPGAGGDAPRQGEGRAAGTSWGDVKRLIASRTFLAFLVAVGCVQSAHAVFYAFGTVHWQALGYSGNAIGALWAIGVIAEIVLFAFSGAAVRAAGAVLLIVAGAAAGALRWTLMAFDPPLLALIVLQTLHALTYGATHLAAVHFIAAHVPRAAAGTAQALYASATAGIGMGAATLLAGKLYAMHGAYAYLAMTVLSVGGGLAVAVLMRWQRSAPGLEA